MEFRETGPASISQARQNAERDYQAFTRDERESGKNLYNIYWKFYQQYEATANPDWDKASVKTKLTFIRTAKAVKYAL